MPAVRGPLCAARFAQAISGRNRDERPPRGCSAADALDGPGLLSLAACSAAGPFVTDIKSDGKGKLFISKSKVMHNAWTGTISNVDPLTEVIDIADLEVEAARERLRRHASQRVLTVLERGA